MSEARQFYLTTAIDYSNGDPHIGHAFEKIGADAIARYHRLRGDDEKPASGHGHHHVPDQGRRSEWHFETP